MRSSLKTARAAAIGGGAATIGYWGVLMGEVLVARKVIGVTDERPPRPDGVYGDDLPGDPLRVLLIGDSAAVGYGMTRADLTPAALLGISMSHVLDRPVDIRSEAVVGAQTSDLRDQIDVGIEHEPELAVIVIGANDVTHRVPSYVSSRLLSASVRRLREAGAEVVVGTCPDLGTVRPIPQPLRWVARRKSRSLARRQTVAVVREGGRAVSLGGLLGPVFDANYDVMFGEDRFHPSATGYANMVSVLVPSLLAAYRERDRDYAVPHSFGHADTMSLAEAAERAGRRPGTEVTPEGRWARVLRRG